MNNKPLPDDLLGKITGQLERDSADIDPAIAARLRESRMNALEASARSSFRGLPRWLSVSGLATAVILIIAASLWIRAPKQATDEIHSEDLEVLASTDQIELYRDLDFYRWLDGGEDGR
jgi:hypothetical protein